MATLVDHWPLLGLRLVTPRLELRLPREAELAALADLAAGGIHDPARMPFAVPWTDLPPAERARSVIQYYWSRLGACQPADWSLPFSVFHDGTVIGQQEISARDFATTRQAATGSWLGQAYQGRGLGTEMRAAVLHLAFACLGARDAVSGAFEDNPASLAVSVKLGYERDGINRLAVRGERVTEYRLRLTRERWEEHRGVPVTVSGLGPCLPLLGLEPGLES
jgi:RimJ/RimL family protein N-acetyltransferase